MKKPYFIIHGKDIPLKSVFKLGERVWFLHNDRIIKGVVTSVHLEYRAPNEGFAPQPSKPIRGKIFSANYSIWFSGSHNNIPHPHVSKSEFKIKKLYDEIQVWKSERNKI